MTNINILMHACLCVFLYTYGLEIRTMCQYRKSIECAGFSCSVMVVCLLTQTPLINAILVGFLIQAVVGTTIQYKYFIMA